MVQPYVAAHAAGTTPNPCVECNRRVKFARLADRAAVLGFDAVATGHHARIGRRDGRLTLERGVDRTKDQSYVVHMLGQEDLAATLLPIGDFEKSTVRRLAAELGLRTAAKPDSQDVCFITSTGGRREFLAHRLPLHPARVVDTAGTRVGTLPAVELVTVGQRKGLGLPGGGPKRYVVDVDRATATVTVGSDDELRDETLRVDQPDVGGRSRRRRRARAVQRPRLGAAGDAHRGRRWSRRPLGPAPAPGGARPERRVLRPHRPLRPRRRHLRA